MSSSRTATATRITSGASSSTIKRQPPVASTSRAYATNKRLDYRIDIVESNGIKTEVITIEDTPEPSSAGIAQYAHSRYEDSFTNNEPAPKKRKSDAAHISDQPYARKRKAEGEHSSNANGRNESGSSRDSQAKAKEPLPIDDKEGHFIVRVGDILSKRYTIIRPLGQGTFGKVVCALDRDTQTQVAVKVIRAVPKYREASKVEIKVLNFLKENDPKNKYQCIHLIECFDYQNHICLVSELLSASVFDFLKENSYNPFPFSHIQSFAKQLLKSVSFLHSLNLIHTDLKPENILLADATSDEIPSKSSRSSSSSKARKILRNPDIRLIDFGSATFDNEYHATVVSTRHYRAPEIIFGFGWSFPCDAWSIGCILIEFFTGEALFQTHENLEHLAMMKEVFGDMPPAYLKRAAELKPEWFKKDPRRPAAQTLDFPNSTATKHSKRFVTNMKRLDVIVPPSVSPANAQFLDLLTKLLKWDPKQRITPRQALNHSFFAVEFDDEGTQ